MSSAPNEIAGTRERILDAVLTSLEEGAEDVVNVAAVARRAGVSRQAVYLHFPNRAMLGVEAARWADRRADIDTLTAPLFAATGPEESIDALARFLAAFNPRIVVVARMLHRLRAIPELNDAWLDRMQARRTGSRLVAERIANAGRLRAPFTVDTATDWIAALASALVWEELTQEFGWTAEQYVAFLRESLTATLVEPA